MNRDEFDRWLAVYKVAWEEGDPDRIMALFTEAATYQETPFGEPLRGHEAIRRYWEDGAQKAQRHVRFTYEIYMAEGDVGICHWHCVFERVPSGDRIELDGVFHCGFAGDGRCRHFQEWWHLRQH